MQSTPTKFQCPSMTCVGIVLLIWSRFGTFSVCFPSFKCYNFEMCLCNTEEKCAEWVTIQGVGECPSFSC